MQTRFLFNRINQDITASIAREVEIPHTRTHAPSNDDLICALIFIVSVISIILFVR